jgi:hypothetical protein
MDMSNKKQSIATTEVFIQDHFSNFERAHLLEHVHFLEERTSELESKVEMLRKVFRDLLALDEEDLEDEYEDEDEETDDELENFFNTHRVGSWLGEEDDEENN